MSRFTQALGTKGSQRWLQHFVNADPAALNAAVGVEPIKWRSPLAADDFAEYRDQAFLDRLGIKLTRRPLDSFWPSRGPQWDALGVSESGVCVLVEAKAHVPELFSPRTGASEASAEVIARALEETKTALGASPGLDWSLRFYQYANRLAHAYLLNELNRVPAILVFLYFVGDADMGGPKSQAEWKSAIEVLHEALGLRGNLPRYVRDAFLPVPTSGSIAG